MMLCAPITITISALYSAQPSLGGTLGLALDALYVFIEQELQQSKQQTMLVDLKMDVIEHRNNSRKKFNDYQSHINSAEKNIDGAERRLSKAREALERAIEARRNGIRLNYTIL
jgi:uncharacterized protein YlxW (UPF0749 family)